MDTDPSRAKLVQDLADAIEAQEQIIGRARKALEDIRFTALAASAPSAGGAIRLTNQVDGILKSLRRQTSIADVASAAMKLFDADQAEVEEADEHLRRLSSTYRTASLTDGNTLRRTLIDAWRMEGRPMPLAMFIAEAVTQGRA